VHQTICTVDIAGYGNGDRTRRNLGSLRAGMYESVRRAFAESGIPWDECFRQDGGDSILALVPGTVSKGAFAGRLLGALLVALHAHNDAHPPGECLRLRLALHAGEVTYDDHGVSAPAVIQASRLLDARPLKEALANSTASLAVIASEYFFTEVIRHEPEYEPEEYRKVAVNVKQFSGFGWIRLPGHELPPEPPAEPLARLPEELPVTQREGPLGMPGERPIFVVPPLRPATPEFFEFVDALEVIPCMRNEDTRAQVVDQLRFAGMVRYFPSRRAHVISILRTCTEFTDGVRELVNVVVNQETNDSVSLTDSVPLKRLLSLVTVGGL
jgi:hypothetical protein